VPASLPTILLIDDDPSHLKLYSWIVNRGGFRALTALVNGASVPLPEDEPVDVAVLDYRLGSLVTAPEVAQRLMQTFPDKPIVVLSDMPWLPDDVAPYVTTFVPKGEPQQLVNTIKKLVEFSKR
jgi:DNA-binding response OmpR family regulator